LRGWLGCIRWLEIERIAVPGAGGRPRKYAPGLIQVIAGGTAIVQGVAIAW
jgi:hypothetical protein